MLKCPGCGLLNPPAAQGCDCGRELRGLPELAEPLARPSIPPAVRRFARLILCLPPAVYCVFLARHIARGSDVAFWGPFGMVLHLGIFLFLSQVGAVICALGGAVGLLIIGKRMARRTGWLIGSVVGYAGAAFAVGLSRGGGPDFAVFCVALSAPAAYLVAVIPMTCLRGRVR